MDGCGCGCGRGRGRGSERIWIWYSLILELASMGITGESGGFSWESMYLQMEFNHQLRNFTRYAPTRTTAINPRRRQSPLTANNSLKSNLELLEDCYTITKPHLHFLTISPDFLENSGFGIAVPALTVFRPRHISFCDFLRIFESCQFSGNQI